MPRKHCNPLNLLVTAHDGHMTEGGRCLLSLQKLATHHCTSTLRYCHFTEHTQPKKNNPKKQKTVDTSAFREDWRRTVKSEEGAGVGVQVELKVPALTHNIQNTSTHRKWADHQLFHCVGKEYNSYTSLLLPNLLTIRTQTRFLIKDNRVDCPTEKWATHNTFLFCSNQRSVLLHLCKR